MNTSKNNVALVTGASDGIGAEFVEILASRGYDLILVARREEKLNELAVRLSDEFEVECTVMVADLSEPKACLLYTSPSPRDATLSRMPSSA